MYPKVEGLDKINCLTNLVRVRSACSPGTKPPAFWAEDLEGWDLKRFARMAKSSSMSGEHYAGFLIGSAAREMMGDIELLFNNGFRLQNVLGEACSKCSLLKTYTANTGIVIKQASASSYSVMRLTQLQILTNVTGTETFVVTDGENEETFEVDLEAGVVTTALMNYSTSKRTIKIYFQDPLIGLGLVSCPTSSSCGCGGSTTSHIPFSVTGLSAGNEVSNQYGFIPCVSISCSYDALICSMVNDAPNIFGLALLYKLGEKVTISKSQAERNNETVSFNAEQEEELVRNYGQLYWAKMKGAKTGIGIANIISQFLQNKRADKCVSCEAKTYTAYATG